MASDGRKTKKQLIAELEELRRAAAERDGSRQRLQEAEERASGYRRACASWPHS